MNIHARPLKGHRLSPIGLKAKDYLQGYLTPLGKLPDAHWQALYDILNNLDRQLLGTAHPVVHLSSADPGLGKTTALRAYCRSMIEGSGVGAMVAISNYRDIEAFVLGMPKELWSSIFIQTSVDLTSQKQVTAYTRENPSSAPGGLLVGATLAPDINSAQLLIITHEKLRRILSREGTFEAASGLYYRGKPRKVKAHDEAMQLRTTVSLQVSELLLACKVVSATRPAAYSKVLTACFEMEKAADDSEYPFPDLEPYGINNDWLFAILDGGRSWKLRDDTIEALTALTLISGQTVRIRESKTKKRIGDYEEVWSSALLTFTDSVLLTLAPVLILDASGRVREYYSDFEKQGLLYRLRTAVKDYGNLTIYHKDARAGKAVLKPDSDAIKARASEIADLIEYFPNDETWLICSHPQNLNARNPVQELLPHITAQLDLRGIPWRGCATDAKGNKRDRVEALTWGRHTSTNAFSHIKNVVTASLLTLPPEKYEVEKRASSNLKPEDGSLSQDTIRKFRKTEHAHDILQAVCRIQVRLPGATVRPSRYFDFSPASSGVKGILRRIFKGTGPIQKFPSKKTQEALKGDPTTLLSDKHKKLFDFIVAEAIAARKGKVKYADGQRHMGVKDTNHFRRAYRENPDLVEALRLAGIVPNARHWVTLHEPATINAVFNAA